MTRTRVDPYGAQCSYCHSQVGFSCVYVHPKFWTSDSQRRFFNNQTTEEQIKLLKQVGEYTKQPHMVRFDDARKAAEARQSAQEVRRLLDAQLPLTFEYSPPEPSTMFESIEMNGTKFVHEDMIEAARDKGYREGMAEGIKEGKRRAINQIATGDEDG